MFIHFARRFVSTRIASRIVGVECERCGCQYYFELRRAGIGEGTAHYGLLTESAKNSSSEAAKKALADRLSSDQEPVPCPKCNWINEYLIDAYRNEKFGGQRAVAVFLGVVLLILSFAWGWSFSTGHPDDRATVTLCFIKIPIGTVAIVAAFCLWKTWQISQFQPNATFPNPPRLPPGTPPALLLDQAAGRLVVASTKLPIAAPNEADSSRFFEFHLGQQEMPENCCLCLSDSDPKCRENDSLEEMSVAFPLCRGCKTGVFWKRLIVGLCGMALMHLGLAAMAIHWQWCPVRELTMWTVLSVPATGLLWLFLSQAFCRPARIVQADRIRGILYLKFQNPNFTSLILETPAEPVPENVELVRTKGLLEEIQATVAGKRLVDVRCEKCGCEYVYEIERTGIASADMTSQGASGAKAVAVQKAQSQLEQQLQEDTELVPCPKCHWVNQNMALAYQQKSYRGCGAAAVVLALFVGAISLVIGWFLHIGPAADRGPARFFLIHCPVTLVVFAVVVIVASAILRSRMDVNQNYPHPPKLPADLPDAMVLDRSTGKLRKVNRQTGS